MNSLVVFFSMMVLAAAKPSYLSTLSYTVPALAPAAISHQSRIDVKSSPALVATGVVAPVSRAVIAEPAIVSAPVAYTAPAAVAPAAVSSQSRIDIKSSPAVVATEVAAPVSRAVIAEPAIVSAPVAYSAPAAVSSQSRIDIKSSPAVFQTVGAAPLAYSAPLTYSAPLAYNSPIAYSAPLTATYTSSFFAPGIASAIAPAVLKNAVISPVAEFAPANSAPIDAALPVAPTETPEVAAARAAHLEIKAQEEARSIQKRSVPLITSYPTSPIVYSSPIVRVAPIAVHAPVIPGSYSGHLY